MNTRLNTLEKSLADSVIAFANLRAVRNYRQVHRLLGSHPWLELPAVADVGPTMPSDLEDDRQCVRGWLEAVASGSGASIRTEAAALLRRTLAGHFYFEDDVYPCFEWGLTGVQSAAAFVVLRLTDPDSALAGRLRRCGGCKRLVLVNDLRHRHCDSERCRAAIQGEANSRNAAVSRRRRTVRRRAEKQGIGELPERVVERIARTTTGAREIDAAVADWRATRKARERRK